MELNTVKKISKKNKLEKETKDILEKKEALEKKNKEKEKENEKKKENIKRPIQVLRRQEQLRKNKQSQNKESVSQLLEDMCILGNFMKEDIIQKKIIQPEKFITIEDALRKNEYDSFFCLGILAKQLEDIGIVTAIEKNEAKDIESINMSSTILQFIMNGFIEKKKFRLHFDLGEKRNEELLSDSKEQEKFNTKLKQKLSLEFKIPEEKIIITEPQKGSYQVQVIFESDDFNIGKEDFLQLIEKCKNEEEFKELSYLKEIHTKLIMEGCKLNPNILDAKGNRRYGWGVGEKRGGLDYIPPTNGWIGFGLNVLNKYDGGNNDWLAYNGNKNEWAVAYHGIGTKVRCNVEDATANIINGENFIVGKGQFYENYDDENHKGEKVGKGVYCSPDPNVMEDYASSSNIVVNGTNYKMGFMMRVKPDKIRCPKSKSDYWVLNGTTNEMRPYRIMVKDCNNKGGFCIIV